MMDRIKQVILIRRDLKMRRGKEIAQGSHASMDFLIEPIRAQLRASATGAIQLALTAEEADWAAHGMAKVCLQVASEEELLSMHQKALDAGLKSYLIRDSGRTEFGGVPTFTACAIGPHSATRIDAVTGTLSLY
jgi:PTH2 family peptidyl-tRNA hydrolase